MVNQVDQMAESVQQTKTQSGKELEKIIPEIIR